MKTFSFFTVLKKFRNVTLSSLILTEGGGGGGEAAEDILIAIKGQAEANDKGDDVFDACAQELNDCC